MFELFIFLILGNLKQKCERVIRVHAFTTSNFIVGKFHSRMHRLIIYKYYYYFLEVFCCCEIRDKYSNIFRKLVGDKGRGSWVKQGTGICLSERGKVDEEEFEKKENEQGRISMGVRDINELINVLIDYEILFQLSRTNLFRYQVLLVYFCGEYFFTTLKQVVHKPSVVFPFLLFSIAPVASLWCTTLLMSCFIFHENNLPIRTSIIMSLANYPFILSFNF